MAALEAFEDLGSRIADRWNAANHEGPAFAPIAAELLARALLHERLTANDVAKWLLRSQTIPLQAAVSPLSFGQPSLTVYRGPGFYIDVYFWSDFSPEMHNHGFAGAFTLIEGQSIHARYEFEPDVRISDRFCLGTISSIGSELVRPGEVRYFSPTHSLIHRLLHTDRFAASVVVRTERNFGPYRVYAPPHVECDSLDDPARIRHIEMLVTLFNVDSPQYPALLREYVEGSDLEMVYWVLSRVFGSDNPQEYMELAERARKRHGRLIDLLEPCFLEADRLDALINLRTALVDDCERFAASALMVGVGREDILALIRARWPAEDPASIVMRCLRSLKPQWAGIGKYLVGPSLNDSALRNIEAWIRGENNDVAVKGREQLGGVPLLRVLTSA